MYRGRANLLSKHIPLELWKVFHGPYVVPPSRTLLASYGLSIEQGSYSSSNLLVLELDPSFRVVCFLR